MPRNSADRFGVVDRRERHAAFTLVEIMIVVMIVGVLAAMAGIGVRSARHQTFINRCHSDLRVISHAIEQMAFDTHAWPGGGPAGQVVAGETWDLNEPEAGLLATDGRFENWHGPYLDRAPIDPWGRPYFFDADYRIEGVFHSVVGSFGPNRQGRNEYDDDDIYIIMR